MFKKTWKGIPLWILVAIATVSLVSAGLLTYYGQIETTIDVSQSVLVDGKPYTEIITDATTTVGGKTVYGDTHYLTNNNPDVDAVVKFKTEGLPEKANSWIEFRLDAVVGEDNDDVGVVLENPVKWGEFTNVSFECYITKNSVYTNSPHVNIGLFDPATGEWKGIVVFNEKPITKGQWVTVTFTKTDSYWSDPADIDDSWIFYSFVIEVADGWDKIQDGQEQTVWVKNIKYGEEFATMFRVFRTGFGNVPAQTIHFRVGFNFPINFVGEVTATTSIIPSGTYTKGGVWVPP